MTEYDLCIDTTTLADLKKNY